MKKHLLALYLGLLTTFPANAQTPRNPLVERAANLNQEGIVLLNAGQADRALTAWEEAHKIYSQMRDAEVSIGTEINQAQALQTMEFYLNVANNINNRETADKINLSLANTLQLRQGDQTTEEMAIEKYQDLEGSAIPIVKVQAKINLYKLKPDPNSLEFIKNIQSELAVIEPSNKTVNAHIHLIAAYSQVVASSQARAIQPRDVAALAKKTVVRIESSDGGFGSGVIIGRAKSSNKNIYTILTAAHVVSDLSNNYRIVTPIVPNNLGEKKRERININPSKNIKILPKVDLALVSFESNYNFVVGTIGNSEDVEEGTPVYVAGFPQPGQAIKRITFQFTGGMISSRLDAGEIDPQEQNKQNNGYDLSYTSVTRAGMSGGPVLDVAGRIIAIHGQGDRNSQTPAEEGTGGVGSSEKTGFNLGIPIQTFLKLQPQSLTTMGMRVDNSLIDYQLEDGSLMIGTNNRKFLRRYRTRSAAAPIFDVTKVNERTSD